ncbi:hypothetical protein ACR2YZ_28370, partial [Klebsiella pneumoniae]
QPLLYDLPDGKGGTTPVLVHLAFDFKELFSLYFLDLFLLSSLPLSEVLYSLLCLLYLSPFFS